MDTVLSLLISVGIIAFGVWIVAGTLAVARLWLGRSWDYLPS